ncbi:MAG TPA: protein kinase [Actinocrinis sp.]|nr:protein kinase [Actinocrinis sp.]
MGQPIGSRYELDEQLGRGAFGSVWRGRVRDTGEAIAVKVLLEELAADPDVVTRFLRERTALVGLRHRSLVAIRDLVVEGDVLALVMQLVEGPDLRAYLRGRGTLGPEEAALLVADVADALSVAHAAKIIHRDVKPANVLLKPEAGGFRPLLTDFGIARLADAPSVTRTSQVVGTPYYLSPEVISGRKATGAVDVYAAGIMLFELLTGHPPFRGRDAMEVFRAHQTATPQRPPGVSDRLWAVATAALAKDPEMRPLAGELASRLRAAVRVKQDGTTVRLPVNPSEGTVVLPALPAEQKIAAGAGAGGGAVAAAGAAAAARAHAAPHAVWPVRAPQNQPTPPAMPGGPQANGSAAPQVGQPQQPAQPASAQQSHNNGAQVIPINRAAQIAPAAAAPTTPIVRPPASANQPTTALPPAAQRPAVQPPIAQSPPSNMPAPVRPYPNPTPQQQNPYPMAYQQAPRPPVQPAQRPIQPAQQPQPAQYRQPQQQTYQAPRNKAPRQPQSYSPNATAKTSGLSCLSKLAILVIVLAIAVALGITVGKQLAKHRPTGFSTDRTSGSSVATSVYEPLAR